MIKTILLASLIVTAMIVVQHVQAITVFEATRG